MELLEQGCLRCFRCTRVVRHNTKRADHLAAETFEDL